MKADVSYISMEKATPKMSQGSYFWEHVTFVNPHPKSLSLWEKDFELLLPFSHWEKGLGG